MTHAEVTFSSGPICLEGILALPDAGGPFPAVAVCHPHPLYGGDMENGIVHAVCDALARRAVASLRFNFRGVGGSGGHFAEGIGEQDDVRAALSFLAAREDITASRLGLCGYSFGAKVAIPVAHADDRVRAVAGISPVFNSPDLLRAFAGPKFFVCGENDNLVSWQQVAEVVAALPEPRSFEHIPGADHFWWGYERRVGAMIADFFSSALSGAHC